MQLRPPRTLKARALQWLAQREHSRAELRRKLLALDAGPRDADVDAPAPGAAVDALLDWLQAHRYLSDERFVESRVHARVAKYGELRIRQELKLHGVALGADAEQALRESELQRACAVRARRFADPPRDAVSRARQARFLAGRGFSADVVRQALRLAVQSFAKEPGPDPCSEHG